MKKLTAVLMSITLILGIMACSNGEQPQNTTAAISLAETIINSETSTPTNETVLEKGNEGTPTQTVAGKTDAGKTLVVYFSMPETMQANNMTEEEANSTVVIDGKVLGNTQYVAQLIQEDTNADIFRIEPETPYTTKHSDLVALATEQQNSNARPKLLKNVENIEEYDIVFLGYPIWWGDMPMIMYTFLESHDLSGKTIIPFGTHGGSQFANTIQTITQLNPNSMVEQNGFTVSRNDVENSKDDILTWLETINLAK